MVLFLFFLLYFRLQKEIKTMIRAVFWDFGGVITSLEKLRDAFVPKKDYFPTDVLDVFPAVGKVQEALYERDIDIIEAKEKGDISTLEEYVGNAVDRILTSLRVPGAVKPTQSDYPSQRYSKNIIGVMDGYIRSVTRFNYQVNTTSHLTKAVQGLANMQNQEQLAGTSKFLLDYFMEKSSRTINNLESLVEEWIILCWKN